MPQLKTNRLFDFLSLIRIEQWIKNLFVFLPMFFNKQLTSSESFIEASVAFITFSLVASSIYCFNDIIDVELDKTHLQKKNRPIASGKISPKTAKIYFIVLAIVSFILAYVFNSIALTLVLLSYFIINIAYTLVLKNVVILDAILIAVSFFLRIVAGSVATSTVLSYWIVIMVLLLSLFLAFAKRRDESIIYLETKIKVRKNIHRYSLKLLNTLLIVLAIAIIGCYITYSLSAQIIVQFDSHYIYLTSVFVILGISRYLFLIKKRTQFANPTKIFTTDLIMQLSVFGWMLSFYVIIYLK